MNDIAEKLQELSKDQEKLKELMKIGEPEEAQKWFSDNGVELSLDDIRELGAVLSRLANKELERIANSGKAAAGSDDELSEDELEEASGGIIISIAYAAFCLALVVGGGAAIDYVRDPEGFKW